MISNQSKVNNEAPTAFFCPFNSYHRILAFNKWQFHVSRCGDRRGKAVWPCEYNAHHLFCDKDKLMVHETEECGSRPSDSSHITQEDYEHREPSIAYCQYNVAHTFSKLADWHEHMQACPDRKDFEKKVQ